MNVVFNKWNTIKLLMREDTVYVNNINTNSKYIYNQPCTHTSVYKQMRRSNSARVKCSILLYIIYDGTYIMHGKCLGESSTCVTCGVVVCRNFPYTNLA